MNGNFVILWQYLILASVLAIIAVVLSALKFLFLIKAGLGKDLHKNLWIKVFSLTSLMNNAIPHGGTAYRAKFLKEHANISYTEFVGLAYLFAFIGLAFLLQLVSFLFLLNFGSNFFLLITLAFAIIIMLAIRLMKNVSKFRFGNSRLDFYWHKLEIVWNLLVRIAKSGNLFHLIGLFFLSAVIDFLVFFLICYAFNVYNSILGVLVIYMAFSLNWLIRLTPGNIGVQELLLGVSSKLIGSGFLIGVALSIISRFVYLLANSIIWVFLRFFVKS